MACAALTLALGIGVLVAGTGPAGYRIEDLGTFGGPDGCEEGVHPTVSRASGLNELGHVVGWAESSEIRLDPDTGDPVCVVSTGAALWRNGEILDLGVFPGGTSPMANAVNDHDDVVGDAFATGAPYHPFLWTEEDDMVDLLQGWTEFGTSWGINNFGEITLFGHDAYFRDVDGDLHQIRFPDTPDGWEEKVYEINDDGITVGHARRESDQLRMHGFRYDSKADAVEDLHDPFYFHSFAYGINEQGDAAVAMTAFTWHGFSSVSTREGDLVVLPLGDMRVDGELRPDLLQGRPHDMNAHGDVIGYDVSVAHRGAVAWIAFDVLGEGPIEKIPVQHLLSPEDQADWEIYYAWGLNDSRQIAGYASHKGKARAFLLTPDDTVLDGDAGIQVTTEAVSGVEPSRVEIETAARLEAVVRVVPESLGPNRAVGMLRPRPSIEPRESDGLRNMEPASGPDGEVSRIAPPAPRSIPRGTTPGDDLEPFDRKHDPADGPRQPGRDRRSGPTTRDDG